MSRGSFVNDLQCAQLHPPGSCRMVMVVHMVNPNEHDRADYRARIACVNETLKAVQTRSSRRPGETSPYTIEFD